ncbi:hypothetical protein GCM10011534_23550 [Pseudooceanicola nanhaiensis]|uniref:Uncharacterized protein n=1 Tax=Pseudooceanicola nanhaiensis TaxID=375761 RepID=A0A917SWE7_9RHOB|nr:hypothetical protein GCM10011534_23550 [Pseudooceanicola nanhaiensis]
MGETVGSGNAKRPHVAGVPAGLKPGEGFMAPDQTVRSTIIFLISAMALAGFRPLGQVFAQFMIVWQR